jgi:hypothetical protein
MVLKFTMFIESKIMSTEMLYYGVSMATALFRELIVYFVSVYI